MKTLVVVNPNSGNGSTGRKWPSLRRSLIQVLTNFEECLTAGPEHATEVVRMALARGVERIIAVGGDGTNNEIVNGFFDGLNPLRKEAVLAFLPQGTGGDFSRTIGIGRGIEKALAVLVSGRVRSIDLGLAKFSDHQGRERQRLFLNITSFGIGGLVDAKVNRSTKAFGGKVSFLIGTFKALASYRNKLVQLRVGARNGPLVLDEQLRINNVAVANGQYFGGGMWVAPNAQLDDGLLDIVILGDLTRREVIFKSSRIYKGTHLTLPKVRFVRGTRVEATSVEEVLIDMDGEQPGRLPISIEILPRVLQILAPPAPGQQ